MPVGFDKDIFVATLNANALPPFGGGVCAKHVRLALQAAGVNTTGNPVSARNYGPFLRKLGFSVVPPAGYVPQPGDIAVIQGTSKSKAGHIEGFDGTNWVSDFIQKEFWPGPSYRTEKPSFEIFRS